MVVDLTVMMQAAVDGLAEWDGEALAMLSDEQLRRVSAEAKRIDRDADTEYVKRSRAKSKE